MAKPHSVVDEDRVRVALDKAIRKEGLRGLARRLEMDPGSLSKIWNGAPVGYKLAERLGFLTELRYVPEGEW